MSIACFMLLILGVFVTWPSRKVLWQGVQVCVADFKLTGSAYPCLFVNLNGGDELGYVILMSPFGPPDTVLTPTRKVVGVEDAWLQSPGAPNYFDAAWRGRLYLKGPDGRPPDPGTFALAVNSALTRSQDQLHIHLGCLWPKLRERLSTLASGLPVGAWTRVDLIPGSVLWAFRTGRSDLAGIQPFRLAAEGLGDKIQERAGLTIFVSRIRSADDELVVLASDAHVSASINQIAVDDLIDLACFVRPEARSLH